MGGWLFPNPQHGKTRMMLQGWLSYQSPTFLVASMGKRRALQAWHHVVGLWQCLWLLAGQVFAQEGPWRCPGGFSGCSELYPPRLAPGVVVPCPIP